MIKEREKYRSSFSINMVIKHRVRTILVGDLHVELFFNSEVFRLTTVSLKAKQEIFNKTIVGKSRGWKQMRRPVVTHIF